MPFKALKLRVIYPIKIICSKFAKIMKMKRLLIHPNQ